MKSIIFISNNSVFVKNGNLNCEIQRLKYLTKYFKVSYISLVSSKKDVDFFFQNNDFLDVKVVDNKRVQLARLLYKLNYALNVILCNKLSLYSNHFFIKSNLLKSELINFDNIYVFYIFPGIFLNLSSSRYHSKNVFIDTNDILVDRHILINKRTWFSVNKKDQDIFNKKNVFFLAISDLDYDYYVKLYTNVFKLFYIDLNKYSSKQKDNLKVGFIASNSELNREEFMMCWNNNVFQKFRDENIEIIVFGSINSFLVGKEYVLDNMLLLNIDNIDLFYSKIDILFSPVGPSTGIKTKVIEALISGTKVITTKFGFDESLRVFSDKIRIINYPISFEESLHAIKSHRENTDIDEFEKVISKYSGTVDNQFNQLKKISFNEN